MGVSGFLRGSQLNSSKKVTSQRKTKQQKTEGTSRTYGQDIIFPSPIKDVAISTTSQASADGAPTTTGLGAEFSKVKTPQQTLVSPQDTLVKVVQKTDDFEETATRLSPSVTSNIASVAALSNKNATVVLSENKLVETLASKGLVGSTLTSSPKIVPNITRNALVLGSSVKSKEEIKKSLTEAQKVDLLITLKSKESESLEFNAIKTPNLDLNFVYNFFVENEEDIEEQEDQSKDPLVKNKPINAPRYVELKWNPSSVTELAARTEEEVKRNTKLRKNTFSKKRGVLGHNSVNFSNSIEKNRKRFNLIEKDGLKKEIADVHSLEKAFDSVVNQKVFSNKISVTLNIEQQKNVLRALPILSIKKK